MKFSQRNRPDTSQLVANLEASTLDGAFFEKLRAERTKLFSAERIAVILRRLFTPGEVTNLTRDQYLQLKMPAIADMRHYAPIGVYRGYPTLLPQQVTKVCRWLFEEQNGRLLGDRELISFNGEVFNGDSGPHADASKLEPYGPTINTVYRGKRRVSLAVEGNMSLVVGEDFREWWYEADKIDFELTAGDMLLFFGFCDLEVGREGNPHNFSPGGLSVCLDKLKSADAPDPVVTRVTRLASGLGHDLLATYRELGQNV